MGSKLEHFHKVNGTMEIKAEEVQDQESPWKCCLVGYFGGKFPGKQALNQIVTAWKVPVNIHHHGSGWIIFQFKTSEAQATVLENGPYIIYGKPLLLKTMPEFFKFENEAISCFPVWIQLRNLPLDLWTKNILGRICSQVGKPIHMDKLTAQRERVTYARCLVEVNMAQDLDHAVMLKLPNGEVFEQPVFYENLPRFCPHCKVVGHTEEGCNAKKSKAKITEPAQARDSVNAGEKGTDIVKLLTLRYVLDRNPETEDELIQNLGSSAQVEDKSSDQVQAAADLKSKPAQAGRKFGAVNPSGKIQEKAHTSSNSKSSPPPLAHVGKKEVKAEEKRKKDSKQAEKKGRAVNFAEFCADLGGGSSTRSQ
ncbi:hypothetical protein Acr_22g0005600 [Actinidia rufa]|uniref:DUF4283 domain-containing protein n=1 Tax=Actinidia rufa TaxID=165716 RepID=A0A7J0GK70_9ERIC|nr:hypothetical protein Acr_22g0005600 [Actinidia rufa]